MKLVTPLLIFTLAFLSIGCAKRLPSSQRATDIMKHHFNKYSNEFKESFFKGNEVEEIEILETREIRKNLVVITAFVTLEDGELFKTDFTLEKKTLGWRALHWENLSGDAGRKQFE